MPLSMQEANALLDTITTEEELRVLINHKFHLTPLFTHQEYLKLGKTKEERLANYTALFTRQPASKTINDIRNSVNRGLAFGSERFKNRIEEMTNRRLRPAKVGRPANKKKERVLKV